MNIYELSPTWIDIHEVSGLAYCPAALTRLLPLSILNINEEFLPQKPCHNYIRADHCLLACPHVATNA